MQQILHNIKSFFSSFPLNKEFLYIENYIRLEDGIIDPIDFCKLSFDYYCVEEDSIKTFELDLPEYSKNHFGNYAEQSIPEEIIDENGILNYNLHLYGICKSCKKKQAEFLISVRSDKKFPTDRQRLYKVIDEETSVQIDVFENKQINVYLTKIAVFPEPKIKIEKYIQKYFDRETNNWYYKGIKSYNEGFGIGSYAYFRRIIEKELIKIFQEISLLPDADSKLNKLISEYKEKNQISTLYNDSFHLLPKSLQLLGENPLKLLYSLTSQGLHNLTEENCLENSDKIHKILNFVIKKIYEEKSELSSIREIIKSIKK